MTMCINKYRHSFFLTAATLALLSCPQISAAQEMVDDNAVPLPPEGFVDPEAVQLGNAEIIQDDSMVEEPLDFERNDSEIRESIRDEAFDAALKGLLPLRPEEIRILLERYDRTQESVEIPIYPDPKPETVVRTVTMDPGSAPLRVKTSFGHVSTINFVDITGAPWPIQNITWAGSFDIVETDADQGSNILRVTPENEYARGNISITMIGMKTPIVMILDTDRDIVHYRFDAIVPDYGPFAEAPLIDKGITLAAGRADISGLLQGMIPSSASRLTVNGVDGRTSAYSYNGLTYLRTPLNLLSPAWSNSVAAADGTKVYEIQNTPVVLLSDKGNMVRAQITEREVLLDE